MFEDGDRVEHTSNRLRDNQETEKLSVYSCKRSAQCASLAMHSTTSLVWRCNNKHYSRLILIDVALFWEERTKERSFTDVECFQPRKDLSTWTAWHLAVFEPSGLGFGLDNRHAATRQCVHTFWLSSLWPKSLHVLLLTALRGSIALQVNKWSLKLHMVATLPLCNSTGRKGSRVWNHRPAWFCREEAQIFFQSWVNQSLLQSASVMCLDGTRSAKWTRAVHRGTSAVPPEPRYADQCSLKTTAAAQPKSSK